MRRRFQDFVFLQDHLVKNFPACVVPPIPDKHRLGVSCQSGRRATVHPQNTSRATDSARTSLRSDGKSECESSETLLTRSLQKFADRISRHPTLQRSQLLCDFTTSHEWAVAKNHHISHPPPESHSSLIDSVSDSLVNAFSKVRKPDPRFIEMNEGLERFEEGLTGVEKIVGRSKGRIDGKL